MLLNENPPHVRRIDTDRPDAFAFEVLGHIGTADIENLYGLLEGAYALHDRIDLIVLMRDFEGFDWSAAFRESTIAGKTQALKHIRRYAVVGGPAWIAPVISLSKPFLAPEIRHFETDEEAAAWQWIGAVPVPD